jgi:hypothetical protein
MIQQLLDAIKYRGYVSGLTHNFYRYPARFSPIFARTAIALFTRPGDTILDPFTGSGTSLVEAFALGRNAVGIDISALAVFLAKVKTCLLDQHDLQNLLEWAAQIVPGLSPANPVDVHHHWKNAGYQDNLPWRFRKVAEQALNNSKTLPERLQSVARCLVLKTMQWAVDSKKRLPTAAEFRDRMIINTITVADGLRELGQKIAETGNGPSTIEVFHGAADTISALPSRLLRQNRPKLVITSPPYPGVHVLYHRWQVFGRRETPAPFWIADCVDGKGSSFYTFGDRRNHEHERQYFRMLLTAFKEIRKVIAEDALVVQLVGFGKPEVHLQNYLKTMSQAGFRQDKGLRRSSAAFWRLVPNRRWYTRLRQDSRPPAEILLLHRPT